MVNRRVFAETFGHPHYGQKLLSQDVLNKLDKDMQTHTYDERNNLMDWLMANQLTKDKKSIALMELWEDSPSALQRRTFWYFQGRLRWTGQTPPDNTADLLSAIEAKIAQEEPEVQWAMNFTAGWIAFMMKRIEHVVLNLVRKRVSTKMKSCQKDVLLIICQSSLRLK